MRAIESVSERICDYDQMLESMARNRYPEAERLKQIKGVGTLIALTYMLTLEDPHRFRKSRDAACYVASNLEGATRDRASRRCTSAKRAIRIYEHLVQAAHHVLGPWGVDSDLRRWGMKLAEHGGKRGKKRAAIAVARKRGRPAASTMGKRRGLCAATARRSGHIARGRIVQSRGMEVVISRVPVTASLPWPNTPSAGSSERSL